MLLVDIEPQVYHDDAFIRAWARKYCRSLPQVIIPLGGSVFPETPDLACVRWDIDGVPVERYCGCSAVPGE